MVGRRALTIVAFAAASLLCLGTLELRVERTGDAYYRFLAWNLLLAWVPFAISIVAFARARRRLDPLVAALLVLWLLFFPNAPYLLTDFIHLDESAAAPAWYDALMLSSFAWTALLLGFASLYLVQLIVREVVGFAASWAVVSAVLALGSFGVYLGRFVRFNSWDVFWRPRHVADVVASQLDDPLRHPRMVVVLIVLTAFLLVGYVVVYAFAGLRLELERDARGPRER